MTRYLLDTNIVSDLIRNPQGRVAQHIQRIGEASICTSIIVAAEVRYGEAKKRSPKLAAQIEQVLAPLEIVSFEPPADFVYGTLRAQLEQSGRMIGSNDLLIAAHALALGHTLVSDNEREFARVPDLPLENWLRKT